MEIKELLWNYFNKTGKIGSYLLLKELEKETDINSETKKDETNDSRLSIHGSDYIKAK